MDDPSFMGRVERVDDLSANGERVGNREGAPLNLFGQRLALDELKNQRTQTVEVFDAMNRRDVRMVQRREDARFALKRARRSGSLVKTRGRILIATSRASFVSRAR